MNFCLIAAANLVGSANSQFAGVMCSPLLKPEPGIQQEPLDYSITTQFETSLKEPNGCGM